MPNQNLVSLIGNITRDIEVKYTPKGKAVCTLSLAIDHRYTSESGEKRKDTTFVDVELWDRHAEIAGKYAKKGDPLQVTGRLKTDSWDDKETGKKRSKLFVVASDIQLLGAHRDSGAQPSDAAAPAAKGKPQQAEVGDDDIPF